MQEVILEQDPKFKHKEFPVTGTDLGLETHTRSDNRMGITLMLDDDAEKDLSVKDAEALVVALQKAIAHAKNETLRVYG